MSSAETEEHARLGACQESIQESLRVIAARLDAYAHEIKDRNAYMWDARRDMDHVEKNRGATGDPATCFTSLAHGRCTG